MNDLNNYPTRLRQALNRRYETLSRAEQDDMLAEIESHIEEALEDRRMGVERAEKEAKVLAELGSPTEMANHLHQTHHSYRWLLSFLIYPALHFLVDFMGWDIRSIPEPLQIPLMMIFPLYLLLLLLVLYRQAAIERDAESNKPTRNPL